MECWCGLRGFYPTSPEFVDIFKSYLALSIFLWFAYRTWWYQELIQPFFLIHSLPARLSRAPYRSIHPNPIHPTPFSQCLPPAFNSQSPLSTLLPPSPPASSRQLLTRLPSSTRPAPTRNRPAPPDGQQRAACRTSPGHWHSGSSNPSICYKNFVEKVTSYVLIVSFDGLQRLISSISSGGCRISPSQQHNMSSTPSIITGTLLKKQRVVLFSNQTQRSRRESQSSRRNLATWEKHIKTHKGHGNITAYNYL